MVYLRGCPGLHPGGNGRGWKEASGTREDVGEKTGRTMDALGCVGSRSARSRRCYCSARLLFFGGGGHHRATTTSSRCPFSGHEVSVTGSHPPAPPPHPQGISGSGGFSMGKNVFCNKPGTDPLCVGASTHASSAHTHIYVHIRRSRIGDQQGRIKMGTARKAGQTALVWLVAF